MSGSIKILASEFTQDQPLQLAPGIKAGFPSPATDYLRDSLDFNRDLIRNPEATFFGRVVGDSMIGAGLDDGDLAVIDRSLEPNNGDIIVAYCCLGRSCLYHQDLAQVLSNPCRVCTA